LAKVQGEGQKENFDSMQTCPQKKLAKLPAFVLKKSAFY
jgi:hypothetical protein